MFEVNFGCEENVGRNQERNSLQYKFEVDSFLSHKASPHPQLLYFEQWCPITV